MKDFLRSIQLIQDLRIELEISQNDFVNKLRNEVEESELGLFSDFFDVFSSNKKEYKGMVSYESFRIKRKRKFFDNRASNAIASGRFENRENRLIIHAEINGFHNGMIFFYIIITVFYLFFLSTFIGFSQADSGFSFFGLPFILIHALLMYSIPYFVMRRASKRLKHNLEREFYYLTKQSS